MTSTQSASEPILESTYRPATTGVLEPVAPTERLAGLDVLRGWAMFGVMWSNLNDWYFPTSPSSRLDHWLSFAQDWFLEGRFYSLLCLLFGIGFAIQLTRARARRVDLRNVYLRRSAALLGIGLIHALLIWHGDVLISYALASFGLLLFRDATPRQQLAWGVFLACAGGYIGTHLHVALGQIYSFNEQFAGGTPLVYSSGTLAQIQHQRATDVGIWWGHFGLNSFFSTVGSFLLGAWAYRSGLVERVITNRKTTWKFLGLCAAVLLLGYSMDLYHWDAKVWPRPARLSQVSLRMWAVWNPRDVIVGAFYQAERAGALLYASVILLVFQTRRGRRLLQPLAAVGRMGLTTYLTQSVVCTSLFYSYGLGWFGKVGFTGIFAITLTVFAVQMAVSTWWLARFRFGPVEWLWRAITYGHAPAMRAAGSRQ